MWFWGGPGCLVQGTVVLSGKLCCPHHPSMGKSGREGGRRGGTGKCGGIIDCHKD